MSAYVVSAKHLAYIGVALARSRNPGHPAPSQVVELARPLAEENIRSVAYRYSEEGEPIEPLMEKVAVEAEKLSSAKLEPVQLLKAIACLEYQSCEHPEWAASKVKKELNELRHYTIGHLPGYDKAEWSL